MRQRSTHEAPVDVPAIPATVEPGEVVDWPDPIAGFEPVDDGPAPAPASSDSAPKSRRKSAPESAPAGEEPKQ